LNYADWFTKNVATIWSQLRACGERVSNRRAGLMVQIQSRYSKKFDLTGQKMYKKIQKINIKAKRTKQNYRETI
jgi:hypothetical protein